VLVLAFMMLWTGKWHRRSNCMTGAEWMIYRFGAGPDARAARFITAIQGVLFTFGMLAYLIKGAGIFLSMFIPFNIHGTLLGFSFDLGSPMSCAIAMVALTTLYTVTAGFLGVVYTDLFQSVIILVSVVVISVMAVTAVHSSPVPLADVAYQVTRSREWMSSAPHWYTSMPKGYEDYKYLFWFAAFYLFRNVLGGMGTGADPRYFGARNERECGLLSFFWTWLMTFRWPMMMGFAVLGLFLVRDTFPDQRVLVESQIAIKEYFVQQAKPGTKLDLAAAAEVADLVPQADWAKVLKRAATPGGVDAEVEAKLRGRLGTAWPDALQKLADEQDLVKAAIPKERWEDLVSELWQKPGQYPELSARLQNILQDHWDEKLNLVSYEGTVNPERVLPAVILMKIPLGLRGLFLISLVAAAMSTFSPTVNAAVALFTRDIYQAFVRPAAKNFELMTASYAAGVFLVFGGFAMAYYTKSINEIWDWIIMGLGTGMAIPGLLRLYWWRFNAWGVVIGTAVGVGGAFVDRGLATLGFFEWVNRQNWWFHWNSVTEFIVLTIIGTAGCVLGTLLTRPTDPRVLEHFYRTTRPFGFWKRLHHVLTPEQLKATRRENFHDIITVPFALLWQITLFILPMQVIIGAWSQFWPTLAIFLVSLTGVLVLWYRNLPPATAGVPDGGDLALVESFYREDQARPAGDREHLKV
jgi:Na+/proline symporter